MSGISKKTFEDLFEHLKLSIKDTHKLYFWELNESQKKQESRQGFDYLEENRMHYLNYEFNKKLDYHKCINDKNQRYIIFQDSQKILIDPWELISKYYPNDLKKLEETAGAHVFFNVVYQIQNFNNIFQMTRHLILRVMGFYGLNDPFQISPLHGLPSS